MQFRMRAWSLTVFHPGMANDWQVQAGGGAVGRNSFLTSNRYGPKDLDGQVLLAVFGRVPAVGLLCNTNLLLPLRAGL